VAFHGGMTTQWWQRAEEKKGSSREGALLLKAAQGGGRGRRKRWVGQWVGAASEAMGGQGGGCGPNVVGTAAPLFRPCG
jgi:hypothetical protein